MSDIVNTEEPLTKPKKPRTAKQLEAFEKVKQRRQQNIEEKKKSKLLESAKLLVENETKNKVQPVQPVQKVEKVIKTKPELQEPKECIESTDDDSEEDVIIVKKSKPKPKKKKKVTRVIIESDSESDSESDTKEDYDYQPRVGILRPNFGDFFC